MQTNLNLINGRFITLDDNDNNIDSITIEDGKIKDFNCPNVKFQTIDLMNNIIIPGFIDSHFHLKNYGKRQDMINLNVVQNTINDEENNQFLNSAKVILLGEFLETKDVIDLQNLIGGYLVK